MLEQRIISLRRKDWIVVEPRLPSKSPNKVAETVLDMSSEGGCLMYHFLFSFPRARSAPRQVSECINHDGNHGAVKSLLFWLLGLHLWTAQWPACYPKPASWNSWLSPKCSPYLFYLDAAKVNVGTPSSGWDLYREEDDLLACVVQSVFQFFSKGCICGVEHTDVSFRSVDRQISAEKRKGSQVLVLEAQWAWVALIVLWIRLLHLLAPCFSSENATQKIKRGGRFVT